MGNIATQVNGIGKKYRIGERQAAYKTLREGLAALTSKPWSKSSTQNGSAAKHDFWALRGVSFEVNHGEVLGIVGRNGAGKSTLLKILSRITEPTEGRARVFGRVGSLLEVGTGFHPELTGRENVYLNGAILGMSKAEIASKFDEIVAFAEVDKFLDTAVKRYSSGMQLRLGFAVAAHFEPEILVVDEVLAVGDAHFQRKCIGKMTDVAGEGRTILFVSHNLGAVRALCTRAILLEGGALVTDGEVGHVIARYNGTGETGELPLYAAPVDLKSPHVRSIEITQDNQVQSEFRMDRPLDIKVSYDAKGRRGVVVTVLIRNREGVNVLHSSDEFAKEAHQLPPGERLCTIPAYALAESDYFLTVALGIRDIGTVEQRLQDVLRFRVVMTETLDGKTNASHWKGICGPGLLQWV